MISYKVKGIILVVIISLASIMMPFSVYADTIDSHIRGRNYTYEPITYNEVQVSTNTYYENIGVLHITFELDDEYIGYVLPNYSIQYDNYFYGASTPNWGTLSKTFDRRIFVNGSSFSFDVTVNWYSISINTAPGGDPFNYDSYTITSSDVTKYADIDSLDQIINILNDLYNSNDQVEGLLNDQLTQLQLVVSNTLLANDYLEAISLYRQWNFPIESMPMIMYPLINYEVYGINEHNNYYFPIFKISNGFTMGRLLATRNSYYIVFATDLNIANYGTGSSYSFEYYIDIPDGVSIDKFELLYNSFPLNTFQGKMIKVTFSYNGNSYLYWRFKNISGDHYYMPLYYGETSNKLLSTDFALNYGLSNNLLDNLQIIANGTNQSNSAANNLENEASEYSDIADDVIGVEEGLTSNFETSVNQIDLNTGLSGFGGNFMTSATWVRTQFDRLTENTPYGSLVVYGLTLGFVLLMLGKVLL